MIDQAPATASIRHVAAQLDSVSKLYGSFAALRKVSVDFAVGSSTVILGDNGAGKSTLLRMLAGLISPSRGAVSVFAAEPHQQRSRIAYMSHEAMLYDELSALENLQYFATLHHGTGVVCSCAVPGDGTPGSRTRPFPHPAGRAILAGNAPARLARTRASDRP
jgi:ABC-type sugar transport system ATPase subunit